MIVGSFLNGSAIVWWQLSRERGSNRSATSFETIEQLVAERAAARKAKDFKRADAIRDELKAKGWIIEDTPKGPKLKKA